MKGRWALFSIVVTGEDHNPTILNPDFLRIRNILPTEWPDTIEVRHTVTTPPFALVEYTNGISIVVESGKLQVIDSAPQGTPLESPIAEITRKYVETLPHVRYRGLGINFKHITERDDAHRCVLKYLAEPDTWAFPFGTPNVAALRLVYDLPSGCKAKFEIDSLNQEPSPDNGPSQTALVIDANFHRDCTGYPSEQETVAHLKHVADDWSYFQEFVTRISGQEFHS